MLVKRKGGVTLHDLWIEVEKQGGVLVGIERHLGEVYKAIAGDEKLKQVGLAQRVEKSEGNILELQTARWKMLGAFSAIAFFVALVSPFLVEVVKAYFR